MNEQLLQKVLSCSKLPSLPAVAMRVIELTADQNVSLRKLAETIQNDQGLTTKILRTVNSPFYGLTKKCSTIGQAQLMLGLNGIKTLALGFSLVNSLKQEQETGFDYQSYWRRGVYSAVGAKTAARVIECPNAEEAFLGGLLQDIGMIALYRALGDEYSQLVRACGDKHQDLGRLELETLEIHHAEVGAMLAERWRLPDTLVAPIRFHEKPTAAPSVHSAVVQCVALGSLAAAAFTPDSAGAAVAQFRRLSAQWLEVTSVEADELLKAVGKGASDLATLLSVSTGPQIDIQDILERAKDRLVEMTLEKVQQTEQIAVKNEQLEQALHTDALTGLCSRRSFQEALADAFSKSTSTGEPMGVALIDPDCLRRINGDHGWEVGDALLKALALRLQEHFRPLRALVGRSGADEFGVLFERSDRAAAAALLQSLCEDIVSHPLELVGCDLPPGTILVTVSSGLAAIDAASAGVFSRIEQLVNAADQALHAAQAAGGNCVRVFTPRQRAAA